MSYKLKVLKRKQKGWLWESESESSGFSNLRNLFFFYAITSLSEFRQYLSTAFFFTLHHDLSCKNSLCEINRMSILPLITQNWNHRRSREYLQTCTPDRLGLLLQIKLKKQILFHVGNDNPPRLQKRPAPASPS